MQILGGEHSVELLKIFSQEAEREITTTSEFAAEEEAENKDFVVSTIMHEIIPKLQIGHISNYLPNLRTVHYRPIDQSTKESLL
jgi:hypothetical protein